MKKTVPIFFSFDNNFVIPAGVAFNSLLIKANSNVYYEMYVLHDDITPENQQILQKIVANNKNAQLEFKNTKGFLEKEWNSCNFTDFENDNFKKGQFTKEALYRCFGARFFPEHSRIIYSDVDVVFMDDISELIDIDFEDNYIAAVKSYNNYNEQANELVHLEGGAEKYKDTYFAGGIWVLNLDLIKKDNLEDKMLDVINDKTIYKRWNDQDVMNIVIYDKVKHISLRYISYHHLKGFMDSKPNMKYPYTKEELIESIEKPKILHFAAQKPWNSINIPNANIWFRELKSAKLYFKWFFEIFKKAKFKGLKKYLLLKILSPISFFTKNRKEGFNNV